MRSLQRLQQSRPQAEASEAKRPTARIHRLRTNAVRRAERARWVRRGRRLILLASISMIAVAGIVTVSGSRIVAGGVVRGGIATQLAPIDGRIAEWLVAPGSSVEVGDRLATLVPLERGVGRDVLVATVREREASVAWFDAGGESAQDDRELRTDRTAVAARNALVAASEVQEAHATVRVRRSELEAAETALVEIAPRWAARGRTLVASRTSLQEQADEAAIQLRLAERDAARVQALVDDHVQSRRALDDAATRTSTARGVLASLRASIVVAGAEIAEAKQNETAEIAAAKRALNVANTRLAEAHAGLDAAESRGKARREELAHHQALEPSEAHDREHIRTARRHELLARVERARAELRAFDQRFGTQTLVAESDGRVDELLVGDGAILTSGTPLLRLLDPDRSLIVVYANPTAAELLSPGHQCTLRGANEGRSTKGAIVSIGTARIPRPEDAAGTGGAQTVAISIALLPGERPLGPGAKVRAAFPSDPWTALRRRVNRWLTR